MIEIEDITKVYGDGTRALEQLSITIDVGMLGLLGPNGAGKTTLLSILVLRQEPSTGRRRYFGLEDRPVNRPEIRRAIGYLPQELAPIADLTGREYLSLCAALRQVPLGGRPLARRVEALLQAVELGAVADRRTATYSGGMKRRLGLAQALVHAPKLLVVDEPTAGLDPEERIRFRNLLTELADEIPVVLSTHIVEDIEATCPRLAILDHGLLRFDGPPAEVLRRAEGRLWSRPPSASPSLGGVKVGRRIGADGAPLDLIFRHRGAPGDVAVRPNLEEAYAVFLAEESLPSRRVEAAG